MSVYKLFLWLAIAVLIILTLITRQPLKAMGACYEAAEEDMKNAPMQQAAANKDLKTVCELGQKNILQVQDCLSTVEAEEPITAQLANLYYFINPHTKPDQVIAKHNQSCMQYPESVITDY